MGRPIAGVAGIVAGLTLIIGTFAVGGFRAASAGEHLLDIARPELSKSGLPAFRRDFNDVSAAGTEIQTAVVPAYAQAEGLTTEQFIPVLQSRYPALAVAGAEGASTIAVTGKAITNLEAHQRDFEAADKLPVSFLPLSAAPAIIIGLGVVLVVAGALALRPSSGRGGAIAVLVLGLILVVFTLGSNSFRNARGARNIVTSLNITKASAIQTRHQLDVQVAGARELDHRVLPDLQAKLGLSQPAFDQWLQARAPHLAAMHGDLTSHLSRFEIDVRIRERGFVSFGRIRDVPIQNMPWIYLAAGLVALLGGALGVVLGWRRAAVGATPAAPVTVPAV